jgi:hypothetical protein
LELSGAGGYEPGKVDRRIERTLSPAEWDRLESSLDALGFWRMPTQESSDKIGVDGAQWVMEGAAAGQYHVIDRWSPKDSPFREACILFLKVAGIKVRTEDLY